jgi:O-antigen ligase
VKLPAVQISFPNLLLILSCYSYPVTAVLISLLKVPSTPVNIGLKFLYALIALFTILNSFSPQKRIWTPSLAALIFFFLVYSIRLLWDTLVEDVHFAGNSDSYVYSYFFGATLLPCFAIILSKDRIIVASLLKYVYLCLFIANFGILFLLLTSDLSLEQHFSQRANVSVDVSDEATSIINPITIGFYGGLLSVLSLNLLFVGFQILGRFSVFIFVSTFLLGIANLVLGASRGPFFGFIFLTFLSLVYAIFFGNYGLKGRFRATTALIVSVSAFMAFALPYIVNNDIALFMRLAKFSEDRASGGDEYRDIAYAEAFNDFLKNPAIGYRFVGTFDDFYPHNVYLEVLMALGVFGACIFIVFQFGILKRIYDILFKWKSGYNFIILLLYLYSFMVSLSSGGIFVGPEVWVLSVFLLSLNRPEISSNENH